MKVKIGGTRARTRDATLASVGRHGEHGRDGISLTFFVGDPDKDGRRQRVRIDFDASRADVHDLARIASAITNMIGPCD